MTQKLSTPSVPTELRRPFDSSRTRVGPILGGLSEESAQDPLWLRRPLDLAAGPGEHPWQAQDLRVLERYHHPAPGATEPGERGLHPPVALLSWLIRNFPNAESGLVGDDAVAMKRTGLAARDPAVIAEGLAALRRSGIARGWHVLEGPTYPDAYFVTPDALIVVERKRTERGVTTATTWMPGRHQMLRHLDAAWEVRGDRTVYGLFIVEASPATMEVPDVWVSAAAADRDDDAIRTSLPHRGPVEQAGIRDACIGVTTWAQVVDTFGLPRALLE